VSTSLSARAFRGARLLCLVFLLAPGNRAQAAEEITEFKVLTEHAKLYLGRGTGAALPYLRLSAGAPFRVELIGPQTLPVELRCLFDIDRTARSGCSAQLRLGARALKSLEASGDPDPEANLQDAQGIGASVPRIQVVEIPEGAFVLTVTLHQAGRQGALLWLGEAPAEPIGEMLPLVPLAAVGAPKQPQAPPAAGGSPGGEDGIELVPLVMPEIAEAAPPAMEKSTLAPSPTARSTPHRETAPSERASQDTVSQSSPAQPIAPRTPASGETLHSAQRPNAAQAQVSSATLEEPARGESARREALFALGPRVGALLPLAGIGGDPTFVVGAEARVLVPGLSETLALGLGIEYYPITTRGSQGRTEFTLHTWVLPITASATYTPLRGTIVSPVLGAGAGAYLGATHWGERESGVSAAFGFFVLGGLELDLGAGGGLLAEVRWARAIGDLGDIVENADLGGLTMDLRYRYLF